MRKIIALCLILMMSLNTVICCACHGSKGSSEFKMPEAFDEGKKYEITFWAKNDTNKAQTDIYKRAIQEFEGYYPNVHVSLKLYTDYGKIYNDVITNIATDTTPNVCITYPDHIATYMTGNNTVVPLDSLISDPTYGLGGSGVKFEAPTLDQMVPEFMEEGKIGGVQYALPYMRSTEALYINKTYVEKLGYEIPDIVTWDFIWEVSRAAAVKDAKGTYKLNGQKTLIPFIYKSTDNMMIQYLKQAGAGYSSETGDILIFNDTTSEFLNTIAYNVGEGAFSTFSISGYPANFLNAGQCVFAVDSTAGSTWMGSKAPNVDISKDKIVEFETVVRPVPQIDVNNPKMISQGPSVCIFNKKDPGEVLAAWLFAQYLMTNSVQTAYAETEGYVPVSRMAQESPEYREYLNSTANDAVHYSVKLAATRLLIENTDKTFITPVFNGSTSLRDAAGYLIESVVKSVRRKEALDLNKLYDSTTSLKHLDQISGGVPGSNDLGPLPTGSIWLLSSIGAVWVLIIIAFTAHLLHERKLKKYGQTS